MNCKIHASNRSLKITTRLLLFFTLVFITIIPIPVRLALAAPITRYVAPGGSCGGATPCYSSVQAAVDAAAAGDEIRVAAGTYTGVNTNGGLSQMVYITKSLTIKGGYTTGNWTTQNADTNTTELQAQTLGRVLYISGSTTNVTVDGLHLTYGNADGLGGHKPTTFENYDAGGGIYATQSTVTINHCWLSDNSASSDGYGGGLYLGNGTLNMTDTVVEDGDGTSGDGIYLYNSQSQIGEDSIFQNNQGHAIRVKKGSITLQDSQLDSNTGTALYVDGEAQVTIQNNTISGSGSGGIHLFEGIGNVNENTIETNTSFGLKIQNGEFTVSENEIRYNEGDGTDTDPGVVLSGITDLTVTMTDNYIHHNQNTYSSCYSGGVYIDTAPDGWVTLTNNIIQENIAGEIATISSHGYGGGVYIIGDNVTLDGNLIQNNTAVGFIHAGTQFWGGLGGGVYTNDSPTLINNVITGNSAKFYGSGIYIKGGSPKFYQNTIAANSAGTGNDETGVYVTEKSSTEKAQPKFWNTIIANQTIGIYNKGDVISNIVFADGILWYGNTSNTSGSGTYFLSHEYTGNPLFTDSGDNNYRIEDGSAAIDVGLNANIPSGVIADADDNPRIANGIVDLGAYENQSHFLLNMTLAGNGGGTVVSDPAGVDCGSDCEETYDASAVIDLTATPDSVSTFTGWSGDADCTDGQVTMDADKTCIAAFTQPITLTVTKEGTGSGIVTSDPEGIDCGVDCSEVYSTPTAVNLIATPNTDSAFAGWTGSADCSDGQITTDEDKTCTAKFSIITKATLLSTSTKDGWILESSETSGKGGSMSTTASTLRLGDDKTKKQYRSILSFATGSGLPDDAVITKVTLKVKKQGITGGGNPVTAFQGFMADIKKGYFGTSALQTADFQTAASKTYGPFKPALSSGWYSIDLTKGKSYINKLASSGGLTQIRLRFKLDDNNNTIANYLSLYSGNTPAASRPQLIIEYYVP